MKIVLSKETVKKFTVFSYGEYLAGALGQGVPRAYGGNGDDLDTSAVTLRLDDFLITTWFTIMVTNKPSVIEER